MSIAFAEQFDVEATQFDPSNNDELQKIVSILQKMPSQRSHTELKSLYFLLQKVEFLDNFWKTMPFETCIELLRALKYDTAKRGQTIFHYGDYEKYFYLILKGSVCVIAPSKDGAQGSGLLTPLDLESYESSYPQTSQDVSLCQVDEISRRLGLSLHNDSPISKKVTLSKKSSILLTKTSPASPSNLKQKIVVFRSDTNEKFMTAQDFHKVTGASLLTPAELKSLYPHHTLLNTLKDSDYFGEIALKMHTKRSATAIARELCHFMVLDAKAYNSIINHYEEKLHKDLLDLFRTSSLIKDWPITRLVALTHHHRILSLTRNNVIYDSEDSVDSIYFIKEGEVEITKEVTVDPYRAELLPTVNQKKDPLTLDKKNLMRMNKTWKAKFENAYRRKIRIAVLGSNQSFGEDDFLNNIQTRQTKAVAKSAYAVIKIIENSKNPLEFMKIAHQNKIKIRWRENMETNIIGLNEANMVGKMDLSSNPTNQQEMDFINQQQMSPKKERELSPARAVSIPKNSLMVRGMTKDKNKLPNKFLKKVIRRKGVKNSNRSQSPNRSESPAEIRSPKMDGEASTLAFYDDFASNTKSIIVESLTKGISIPLSTPNNVSLPILKSTTLQTKQTQAELLSTFSIQNSNKAKSHILTEHKRSASLGITPTNMSIIEHNRGENKIQKIGLSVVEPFRSSLNQNDTKSPVPSQTGDSVRLILERVGFSKLFVDTSSTSTNQVPLQFYITSKGFKTSYKEEFKGFISEEYSPLQSPHIKATYRSPRMIPSVKTRIKSLHTSFLPLDNVSPNQNTGGADESPMLDSKKHNSDVVNVLNKKKCSVTTLELSIS